MDLTLAVIEGGAASVALTFPAGIPLGMFFADLLEPDESRERRGVDDQRGHRSRRNYQAPPVVSAFVLIVVTTIWAAGMVTGMLNPKYDVPVELHGFMGATWGIVFGFNALARRWLRDDE